MLRQVSLFSFDYIAAGLLSSEASTLSLHTTRTLAEPVPRAQPEKGMLGQVFSFSLGYVSAVAAQPDDC